MSSPSALDDSKELSTTPVLAINTPQTATFSSTKYPAPPSPVRQPRPRRHSAPDYGIPVRYDIDTTLSGENVEYLELEAFESNDNDSSSESSSRAGSPSPSSESDVEFIGTLPAPRRANGSSSRFSRSVPKTPVASSSSLQLPSTSSIPSVQHSASLTSRRQEAYYHIPTDATHYVYQPSYSSSFLIEAAQAQYPPQQYPVESTTHNGTTFFNHYIPFQQSPEQGPYLDQSWYFGPPGLPPPPQLRQQLAPVEHDLSSQITSSSQNRSSSPLSSSTEPSSSQSLVPFPILSESPHAASTSILNSSVNPALPEPSKPVSGPSRLSGNTTVDESGKIDSGPSRPSGNKVHDESTKAASGSGSSRPTGNPPPKIASNIMSSSSIPANRVRSITDDFPEHSSVNNKVQNSGSFKSRSATSQARNFAPRRNPPGIIRRPFANHPEAGNQGKLQILAAKAIERRRSTVKPDVETKVVDQRREERKAKEEEERMQRRLQEERRQQAIEAEIERVRKEQREETQHLRNWEIRLQKEEVRLWKEAARLREEEEHLLTLAEEEQDKEEKVHRRDIEVLEAEHHQKERMQEEEERLLKEEEERLMKEEERLRMAEEEWVRTKAEEREAQRQQKDRLRAEEERLRKEAERLRKEKERLLYEDDRLQYQEEKLTTEKGELRREIERLRRVQAEFLRKEEEEQERRKAEKREAQRRREEEQRKRKEAEEAETKRIAEERARKEEAARLERKRKAKEEAERAKLRPDLKPRDPCERAGGRPCTACQKMDLLHAQFRKLLSDYEEGLAEIEKSHLTLVLKVPAEILTSIFIQLVSESYQIEQLQSKDALIVPLRLAWVCKEWRRIAFTCPDLWTVIFIGLKPSEAKHFSAVKDWISRSDKLPLRIHMQGPPTVSKDSAKKLYPIIDAVNNISKRWKELVLCLPPTLLSRIQGSGASFAALEILRVRTPLGLEQNFKGQLTFKNVKPGPQFTTVDNVRFAAVGVQWERVGDVHLSGLGVDECLQLIKQGSNLVICRLRNVVPAGGHFPLPNKPISQELITHLELDARDNAPLHLFFANVMLPGLESLEISARSVPNEAIVPFIRRSKCSLDALSISHCAINNENLVPVLKATPTLTSLFLEPSKVLGYDPQALFQMLGKTAISGGASDKEPFLPNLKSLTFLPCSEKFDWHCVPMIFGPIANMENPKKRPLNDVEIQFYFDDPYTPKIAPADVMAIMDLREAGVEFKLSDQCDGSDLMEYVEEQAEVLKEVFNLAKADGVPQDLVKDNLEQYLSFLGALGEYIEES